MANAAEVPLAIIGMSARLPGAEDLDSFWDLLVQGRTELGELPPERFNPALAYDPHKSKRNRSYTKLGGITEERPFNRDLAPIPDDLLRRSHAVHLKLAETAAAAFRHANLDPASPPNCRTGVYIGHTPPSALSGRVIYARLIEMTAQYLREVPGFNELPPAERDAVIQEIVTSVRSEFTDNDPRLSLCSNAFHAAGVISQGFGLDGPSMSFDAACASSLRALGHGARALQLGQIDMAVIGGASYCHQDVLVLFSQAQSVSPSGSRPFDNDADGLVAAEGYAVVLIKTLEKAIADGDPILSIIRGIGISSDGKGKSLWAPRREGQIEAIRRTYRNGLKLSDLQFIEMHATSTQVGDATEMSALAEVSQGQFAPGTKIPVGSVKANVGHTLESAGIASLVKTVLAMQHGIIPPQINVKQLNETIDWPNLPFYVPLEPTPWNRPDASTPRRAAVNAFGIGGLNVHVALEEYIPESSRSLIPAAAPAGEKQQNAEPIAIIGMGAVLPGARTIDALWDVLQTGRSIKREVPADRWDSSIGYEEATSRLWRVPARTGGFIDDFDYDWKRHKVPPKQISTADPLQFMLLDAADQAFRDAGYNEDNPYDRMKTGVIVGTIFCGEFADQLQMGLRLPDFNLTLADALRRRGVADDAIATVAADYEKILLKHMPALIDETGSFTASTLASRITKTFDLMGGATAVDSGDASSMAALNSCMDLLRAGDCDMMICAAGARSMGYAHYESLARAGQLAGNEAAGPFDVRSDGLVPGEGVGVLLLKRLSDAQRDGNTIHGVIHGIGVAYNPSLAAGFEQAIERGAAAAGVTPDQVSVVEAAASGQPDLDRDESIALSRTYGRNRNAPLLIGSAGAQFGHTAGASGMVEVQKAIGELNHVEMPAVALTGEVCPELRESTALQLPTNTLPVPPRNADGRLFAGVNSFSQTNVAYHLILEGAVRVPLEESTATPAAAGAGATGSPAISTASTTVEALAGCAPWQIVRLSGNDPAALRAAAASMAEDSAAAWNAASDGWYSAGDAWRLAIVASGPDELAKLAKQASAQLENESARTLLADRGVFVAQRRSSAPRVAFLFPGQGSQYTGMLRPLIESFEPARAAMQEVDTVLSRLGLPSFETVAWQEGDQLGTDVWRTQLSLLAADTIVFAAARSLGLQPQRVGGHSFGELAAMVAAGCWTFEEAVRATSARCQAIDACTRSNGIMLSTSAPATTVEKLLQETDGAAWISHRNAPEQTVVGGEDAPVRQIAARLEQDGFKTLLLDVPAAFHTPLMEEVRQPFGEALAGIRIDPPMIPLISSVTNRFVADPDDIRENLVVQMTQPVNYTDLLDRLVADHVDVIVETGPKHVLTGLHRKSLADSSVLTVGCDHPKRDSMQQLLSARACMEVAGALDPASSADRLRIASAEAAAETPSRSDSHLAAAASPAAAASSASGAEPGLVSGLEHLNVLRLAGTPADMGRQHGRAMQPAIRRVLRRHADLAGSRWDRIPGLEEASAHPERFFGPAELDELRGIAAGAEVELGAVIAHNLRLFLDAGSGGLHVAFTAGSRRAESLLHAVNEDLQRGLSVRDCLARTIQVRHPQNGLAHLAFCVAGQVGTLNGINAAGLAVSTSALLDAPRLSGTTTGPLLTVLVRNILEQASTIEDAIQIISRTPGSTPFTLCLSQHTSDRLCYVEFDGTQVLVDDSAPAVAAANHRLMQAAAGQAGGAEAPAHSQRRLNRLQDLLAAAAETPITPDRLQGLLRDRYDVSRGREVEQPTLNTLRRPDNQISLIFEPSRGNLWVTGGPLSNGHQNDFAHLRIDELLQGAEESRTPAANGATSSPAGATAPVAAPSSNCQNAPASLISLPQLATAYEQGAAALGSDVCSRLVMRVLESPLPAGTGEPALTGRAIILGENPVTAALAAELSSRGIPSTRIPLGTTAEATLAAFDQAWQAGPAQNLFLTTPCDVDAGTSLEAATWTDRRTRGVTWPYMVCQRWYQLTAEAGLLDDACLAAVTRMGGDFGFAEPVVGVEGGGLCGLLKGIQLEVSMSRAEKNLRVRVIDTSEATTPEQAARATLAELATGADGEIEAAYRGEQRFVPRPVSIPLDTASLPEIPRGGNWIITGGARGVTAVVARELGARYGLTLQLIGSSPLPEIQPSWRTLSDDELKELRGIVMKEALANGEKPIDAWGRFEKALEIDATLQSFAEAGIQVRYHACNVGNREALAAVLDEIRRTDGPIDGIVHGAGYERACRFEKKQLELVERTISSKVDGAAALLELTKNDPVKLFAAFGSVSGRFGGVGQTDYCVANEMVAKLMDWARQARPDCRCAVFHWHAWDDVGMAVRPESQHIRKLHNINFMPSREGADHLISELCAGLPESEIAITELSYCREKYGDPAQQAAAAAAQQGAALQNAAIAPGAGPGLGLTLAEAPVIDAVTELVPGQTMTAEVHLDPVQDVFLAQHRFKGRPLMPVVMTMEVLAEAAALLFEGQRVVTALKDISIQNGLRFHTDEMQRPRIHAAARGTGEVDLRFTCDFHNRHGKLLLADKPYLSAVAEVADQAEPLSYELPEPPAQWNDVWYPEEDIVIYHGPAFRRLRQITFKDLEDWGAEDSWGRLVAPEPQEIGANRAGSGWMTPAALLDSCFFACGIILWVKRKGVIAIPDGIERIRLGRMPRVGESCIVHVRDRERLEKHAVYDFTIFGEDGSVIMRVDGYRNVIVAEEPAAASK